MRGRVMALYDADMLIVDFDFAAVEGVFGACGRVTAERGRSQPPGAISFLVIPPLPELRPSFRAMLVYLAISYTITLASSTAVSSDAGTGGVKTMCLGTIA